MVCVMSVEERLKNFDNEKYAVPKIERTYVEPKEYEVFSPSFFKFYVLQDRYYKNSDIGSYNLMCQLGDDSNRFVILGVVKGTKEEAIAKLRELVFVDMRQSFEGMTNAEAIDKVVKPILETCPLDISFGTWPYVQQNEKEKHFQHGNIVVADTNKAEGLKLCEWVASKFFVRKKEDSQNVKENDNK